MAGELYFIESPDLPPEVVTAINAIVGAVRDLERRLAEATGDRGLPAHHYARAGPGGIAGADYTDPDHPIPAEGDAVLLIDAVTGPMIDGAPIRLRNPWPGPIEADWPLILVVRVDGRWSVAQLACPVTA